MGQLAGREETSRLSDTCCSAASSTGSPLSLQIVDHLLHDLDALEGLATGFGQPGQGGQPGHGAGERAVLG